MVMPFYYFIAVKGCYWNQNVFLCYHFPTTHPNLPPTDSVAHKEYEILPLPPLYLNSTVVGTFDFDMSKNASLSPSFFAGKIGTITNRHTVLDWKACSWLWDFLSIFLKMAERQIGLASLPWHHFSGKFKNCTRILVQLCISWAGGWTDVCVSLSCHTDVSRRSAGFFGEKIRSELW